MRVHLPNSAHLQNIDGFLSTVEADDSATLTVSFHDRWVSVHPFTLALAASMGAICRARGGEVRVDNIPGHRSIGYLIRMGLFRTLGIDPGREITEHEASGRFIPLTQIKSNADLKAAITDLVPLLHAPAAVADPIRYLFSELARNVLEHSASPVGGFVCAQYYKDSNRIAIGIADSGIGILQSMARHHRVRTDAEAIRLALQPGVTGTTSRLGGTEFNAGAGLFFTKSIAALSRNFFVIYSGSSAFKLLRTPAAAEPTLHGDPAVDRHHFIDVPRWPGTVVGIDVSVQEEIQFAILLEAIRKAYSVDVKAKKKAYYKKIQFQR